MKRLHAGLVVCLCAAHTLSCKRESAPAPDVSRRSIPAAHLPDSDALSFLLGTDGDASKLALQLTATGNPDASLTLDLMRPPETASERSWGSCRLSSAHPGAFVSTVASWLGVAAPPMSAPLSTPACTYSRLGDEAGREVYKLTLEAGKETAEVFLRLRDDRRQADFAEKGSAFREPLVRLLAASLQPPREPAEAHRPIVAELLPLHGAGPGLRPGAWAGNVYIAPSRGEVWAWVDPAKSPRRIFSARSAAIDVYGDTQGKKVAVRVVHLGKPDEIHVDDPTDLVVLDLASSRSLVVARSNAAEWLAVGGWATFSPDDRKLAITATTPGPGMGRSHVRIIDLQTLKVLAQTVPALVAQAFRWDADGVMLSGSAAEEEPPTYRWNPESGRPPALVHETSCARGCVSPDAQFEVRVTGGGLDIVEKTRTRHFSTADPLLADAMGKLAAGDPTWIGKHRLALYRERDAWGLDLVSLELRPLLAKSLGTIAFRDDFRALVGNSDEDGWVWAPLPE